MHSKPCFFVPHLREIFVHKLCASETCQPPWAWHGFSKQKGPREAGTWPGGLGAKKLSQIKTIQNFRGFAKIVFTLLDTLTVSTILHKRGAPKPR